VVKALKESGAEVLVNYLPVGSEEATKFYAECALEAGTALLVVWETLHLFQEQLQWLKGMGLQPQCSPSHLMILTVLPAFGLL